MAPRGLEQEGSDVSPKSSNTRTRKGKGKAQEGDTGDYTGAYVGHLDTAIAYRQRVHYPPDLDPKNDPTIDQVAAQEAHYVRALYEAILNLDGVLDKENSIERKWVTPGHEFFDRELIEATATLVFHLFVDRVTKGYSGRKDKYRGGDRRVHDEDIKCNAQTRILNIIEAFMMSKCICRDALLHEDMIRIIVDGPVASLAKKGKAMKHNDTRRQKQVAAAASAVSELTPELDPADTSQAPWESEPHNPQSPVAEATPQLPQWPSGTIDPSFFEGEAYAQPEWDPYQLPSDTVPTGSSLPFGSADLQAEYGATAGPLDLPVDPWLHSHPGPMISGMERWTAADANCQALMAAPTALMTAPTASLPVRLAQAAPSQVPPAEDDFSLFFNDLDEFHNPSSPSGTHKHDRLSDSENSREPKRMRPE